MYRAGRALYRDVRMLPGNVVSARSWGSIRALFRGGRGGLRAGRTDLRRRGAGLLQRSRVRVGTVSRGSTVRLSWARVALVIVADLSVAQAQEVLEVEKGEEVRTETNPSERLTKWNAPPSCIPIEDLRRQVEKQIMGEPDVIREVRGEMLRGPAGWIVTFTVHDSNDRLGERLLQLSGDDCRAHDETLALVIALLLEHGPPPPPEEDPPPTEPDEREPAQPAALAEEREPLQPILREDEEELLLLRGGIGWGATTGWLPRVSWGPTAFFGVVLEQAAVELGGDYYLPDESTGVEDAMVSTWGGRVHLRGCRLPEWGSWGASVCVGLGWLALSASGRGGTNLESVLHWTVDTSLSGTLIYRLGSRLGLEAGVELIAPFSRGRFVFEGPAGEILVHKTRPILFAPHVGVVLTL